ncbi:HK97 family phage portal protein [Pseudorhizobium tarimense]|uniref:HK97 family phage portal protein n=1 Tax=Pseudorhizobium tarimense TaxID=1079109 RepID=A0ABV2H0X7_9HYPH|nr:phage portal protein [Pseudorhizobium tarimense]
MDDERPLLLEEGLDWKAMGFSPKDMDFIEAKNAAARDIALSLGVPPMLIGIPGDNTYSNYQEANRAFYRLTVVPLLTRTAASLSAWLPDAYGEALRLASDLDQLAGLSAERDALWARFGAADFLTDEEKRQAVGYQGLKPRTGGWRISGPSALRRRLSAGAWRAPARSRLGRP